jgi:tetratricopeptide (TPR) repeat protein
MDYSRAIELDPNYTAAYNGRAISNKYLKKFDEAMEDFFKAIELDPTYTNAYNSRGNVYSDL